MSTTKGDRWHQEWVDGLLKEFREYFTWVGDRRDSRPNVKRIVHDYGNGTPPIQCACGIVVTWASWPEHWRTAHADPR